MSEWKDYKLGDIVNFQNGFAFKSSEFRYDGKYKIIRIKELKNGSVKFFEDTVSVSDEPNKAMSKFLVNKGDVIFALTGDPVSKYNPNSWVGRVSLYKHNEPAYLNQRTCKITQRGNVIPQYVFYYFRHYDNFYSLASKATGSASQANISTKTLEDTIIILPSLEVQTKIVNILSSLDEKIETNRKINARLEELAQALFKSWFIDFEPFGGKMPEDWKIGCLSDIADIIMGQSPNGNSLNNNQDGMIFYQGKTEFNERFPSIKNFTTEITRVAPANSILLSVRAPVGEVNITLNDCCIGRGIASINFRYGSNSFLYLLLKNKADYFNIFDQGGTVFGCINKKALIEMPIIIPAPSIIESFNNILSPVDEEIERRSKESARLAALRDTLLPKLMSGELIPE